MQETRDSHARRSGMGAIVHGAGTAFRVWAPHTERVYVTGEFNDWSRDGSPLESDGNGHWCAEVADARPGHEYRYLIHNGPQRLSKNDPSDTRELSPRPPQGGLVAAAVRTAR